MIAELVACAILNLGMAALRRSAVHAELAVEILETDAGMRFRVAAPGTPLQPSERINIFAPYGRHAAGSAMYGLGLALARALIELSQGSLWVEDLPTGGCAFVFEVGNEAGQRTTGAQPGHRNAGARGAARTAVSARSLLFALLLASTAALAAERRRHSRGFRARKRYLPVTGRCLRQTGANCREDGRRQDGKVLRGSLSAGAAVYPRPDRSIGQLIATKIGKLGENIAVRRLRALKWVKWGQRSRLRPPARTMAARLPLQ